MKISWKTFLEYISSSTIIEDMSSGRYNDKHSESLKNGKRGSLIIQKLLIFVTIFLLICFVMT